MQSGAVTLKSEEGYWSEAKGIDGYGLARDEDVHDFVKSHRTVVTC